VPDIFVGFANGTRGFYVFSSSPPPRGGAPRLPRAVTFHPWLSSDTAGVDVGCAVVGGDIALPAFVDLDGDCLADLVVPTTCGLEVWRNPASGSRTFWELSVKRDTGSYYRFFGPEVFNHVHGDAALVFADFDGDGTIDIGVPNRNRKDLLVFRNVQSERKRGNLCTPDPAWRLKARVGLASGLHLDPGSIGPLFGRISVPTSVHIGDYDLDGLPDLLIVDSSKGIPVIFRNLGHWDSETAAMQPHFAPIADNAALAKAAGSGTAIAALFFDTDEIGRQDIMVIKNRNSTSLVWNTFITKSDSLFFKGTCLSALPYHGPARPFAPVAGNTFKVSYMARTSRHRVTRICSQCSQSGPWSLKPCNCLFGLLQISNYIEEIAVGAGGASRSWTNLMPNSMAVVWAEDTRSASGSLSSADWWMEYFTQRRGGQMLRVVAVLTVALGVLGASILLLQQRERKEDRANESEHVQLFNFGGPI
jgi:FG-GAP-like repeat